MTYDGGEGGGVSRGKKPRLYQDHDISPASDADDYDDDFDDDCDQYDILMTKSLLGP